MQHLDTPPQAPDDADARTHALLAYGILDTPPEAPFDDLARLAAQVCAAPSSFLTFLDDRRQFFKASVGTGETREATLESGFCPFTVRLGQLLVIPDTLADPRFQDNPAAHAQTPVRFYAGVPICDHEGRALGSLCVVDQHPRELRADQAQGLRALGRQVEAQLLLRRAVTTVEQAEGATERAEGAARRAEEAASQSEARLRGVADSFPALIAYVDAEERYQFNNRAYEEWVGLPREQVTGRTMREVVGDQIYGVVAQNVAAALSGDMVTYERELTWPDGTTRAVRGTYAPQRGPSGAVEGFAILVTDHTEQRRTEEERRAAAERHAALVAAQQEVARADRDLTSVLTIIVRRAQAMTGADGAVVEMAEGEDMVYRVASGTAADHIGLRLRRNASLSGRCVAEGRLLSCEDTETDPRVDRQACRRIGVRSMVVVPLMFLGRTVGVLKVYSASAEAFPAASLPLLEMMVSLAVAALSAVSEAEARAALSLSEQRLLFAIEGAGIGTWSWDIGTDSLAWSPRCKELFGLPPEGEMTRALFYGRIHPEDRPHAEETIARSLAEGRAYDIEYRVAWPDGSVHWLAAKGRGYQDAAGRAARFEGTMQDIDSRKAAEATLRAAAERQKTLLRDVLASVTGGRLRLVETEADLPALLPEDPTMIPLTPTEGLRALRQRVREVALGLGFADERWQDLMTAASEGGMNAVTHGGGQGEARVSADGHGTVQVRVQDWGAGINMENLPQAALSRGWSSTASLGHGLVMMLQSVDRLWLLTGNGGTTVVLEQDTAEPPPAWL